MGVSCIYCHQIFSNGIEYLSHLKSAHQNERNTESIFQKDNQKSIKKEKKIDKVKNEYILNAVAKELNVNFMTLVNFLKLKGLINSRVKITSEQYAIIKKQKLLGKGWKPIKSNQKFKPTRFEEAINKFIKIREEEGKVPPSKLREKSIYLKKVRGGRPESNRRKF